MLREEIIHIGATEFRGAYVLHILWAKIPNTKTWISVKMVEMPLTNEKK